MKQTRRTFIRTTGVAVAAVAGSTLFDPSMLMAGPPFTRRDVGGLAASDPILVSYKKAIDAMKALPNQDTNPLSWTYQAAIHGSFSGPAHPAWATCEHGTLFFLSWHRMYLYWFERIIRKMSGDSSWTLPFWNYESASERALPMPFRTPTTGNALYNSHRGAGWNDTSTPTELDPSAVDTSVAFDPTNVAFSDFSPSLEGTPHAAVHIAIDDWMGAFETAALDPIFWLHHCNIDRLWNAWLALGGGRTDPLGTSTEDQDWQTRKFLFFDENGGQVHMTGCDILRAQEQLGYVYESEPAQVKLYCGRHLFIPEWLKHLVLQLPPIKLPPGPDPAPFEFDVSKIRERLVTLARDPNTDVTLDLGNVEADRQPNVYYEVYVGLPKGARPEFKSPFYVGNVALFAHAIRDQKHAAHGEFRPARFSFKIDRAVAASLGRANEPLRIVFVPKGGMRNGRLAVKPVGTITIGSVAIGTKTLKRQ